MKSNLLLLTFLPLTFLPLTFLLLTSYFLLPFFSSPKSLFNGFRAVCFCHYLVKNDLL